MVPPSSVKQTPIKEVPCQDIAFLLFLRSEKRHSTSPSRSVLFPLFYQKAEYLQAHRATSMTRLTAKFWKLASSVPVSIATLLLSPKVQGVLGPPTIINFSTRGRLLKKLHWGTICIAWFEKKVHLWKKYSQCVQRIFFDFFLENIQNLIWKKAENDSFGEGGNRCHIL